MRPTLITLAAAMTASTTWTPLAADDGAVGLTTAWKLASYELQAAGEPVIQPFGPEAKGSLVLTAGGRWTILVTAGDRKPATDTAERAGLLGSLLAYTGRYTIAGRRITIEVDASWNEIYTGALATQVRFFEVEGDRLTVRTPEIDSAVCPGKRVVATLVFTREH